MSMSEHHDLERAHSHMKSTHAACMAQRNYNIDTQRHCHHISILDHLLFDHLKVLDPNLDCRSLGFISHFFIKVWNKTASCRQAGQWGTRRKWLVSTHYILI